MYITKKKRAVIGIGTLIIFIAMILVAAVAAGVIIRTSGILQERAFAVGGEARKRLVTGIEILQVFGTSNLTASTVPEIEVFVRTRPGSRPVQLKTTGMTFSTQDLAFSAELQHSQTESYNTNLTGILNSSWASLNFDMNKDYLTDYVRIFNTTGDLALIQFNISGIDVINVSTTHNFSGTGERNYSISESEISFNYDIYGYLSVSGNVTTNQNINASTINFGIRQFPSINVCNFNVLIPERFYCFESRLGDSDTVLEQGELYIIRYKLKQADAIEEEETFQMNFMPKDGSVTFLEAAPPSVIGETKLVLWPS